MPVLTRVTELLLKNTGVSLYETHERLRKVKTQVSFQSTIPSPVMQGPFRDSFFRHPVTLGNRRTLFLILESYLTFTLLYP